MSLRVSNNNGYTIGYNSGINYADGRVNTNSINYQSGYNSGISYADSRVNTSSTNYSTGYNNGYSNGKNVLSTLTDGELLLLSLLGKTITSKTQDITATYVPYSDNRISATDSSKIQSVNCTVYLDNNFGTVSIFGADFTTSGTSSKTTSNSTRIAIILGSPDQGNGYRFGQELNGNFTINSFTTTDGKVHTASNLNY